MVTMVKFGTSIVHAHHSCLERIGGWTHRTYSCIQKQIDGVELKERNKTQVSWDMFEPVHYHSKLWDLLDFWMLLKEAADAHQKYIKNFMLLYMVIL